VKPDFFPGFVGVKEGPRIKLPDAAMKLEFARMEVHERSNRR
jgi:hypothetical protein